VTLINPVRLKSASYLNKNKNTRIVFRADGNSKIGLGHVYRLLALAEILRSESECTFVIKKPEQVIIELIKKTCHNVQALNTDDPASFIDLLTGTEIVVLDGYQFTTSYQQAIKKKGSKLVCIDDLHDKHFVADAIINHAMGVKPVQYSAEPYTKFYLGMDYVLLRKEFRNAVNGKNAFKSAGKVFICLGGTDPYNLTTLALESISAISGVKEIHIVTSHANVNLQSVKEAITNIQDQGKCDVSIYLELSAADLVKVIKETDVAVVSSSNISYEIISLNKVLICGWYVENQKDLYEGIFQLPNVIGVGDLKDQLYDKIQSAFKLLFSTKYSNMVIGSPFGDSEKNILEVFNKLQEI
jgi:UDP-2,4-diacetamido-2,4,6-trideoxy-beta-L-altropyranose hydrolase